MVKNISWRKYLLWALVVIGITAGAYYLYNSINIVGPDSFSIATGRPGGAYHAVTQEYARLLATQGITLELVETAGSVQTLDMLSAREVPAGLVQSGVVGDRDATGLYSLGSLFYEPIMVFFRKDRFEDPLEYLYALEGKAVAIGEMGSGTNQLARILLADNGLDDASMDLRELSAVEAYAALANGDVDAAFFVLSPAAEIVYDLFDHPDLELMNMRRAGAYEARYPYLTQFAIPEGTVDLQLNVPHEEKVILTTTAMLVANELLHADSASQLLAAAADVHGGGDYFAEEWEFPSVKNSELPVPSNIQKYLELGPNELEEYLPVSIAAIVQRLVFVVLPAVVLLYPLLRGWPGVYSWANRYRIYRWYQQIRRADVGTDEYTIPELESEIAQLYALEQQLTDRLRIPMFYQREFYNLRIHLRLVVERLEQRRDELLASSEETISAVDVDDGQAAVDADDRRIETHGGSETTAEDFHLNAAGK